MVDSFQSSEQQIINPMSTLYLQMKNSNVKFLTIIISLEFLEEKKTLVEEKTF